MMHKSKLLIFMISLGAALSHAQPVFSAESPDMTNTLLTADDISRLAIADSLGIKMFKLDNAISSENAPIARGEYDLHWFGRAGYTRDETPNTSVFAPTLSEESIIETGFEKKITWGTDLKFSWLSDRDESNSSFVSINPSYDQKALFELNQPLLRNAFGLVDRAKLRQVDIDVQWFNYQTLQNIQDHVMKIRQMYWQARQAYQTVLIRKRGLEDAIHFHEVTQEKLELGMLEEPDDFAAKANVKEKEIEVLIALNRAKDLENELKNALSMNLDEPMVFEVNELPLLGEMNRDVLMRTAMTSRYDHQQHLLNVEKMDLEVQIAKNGMWPKLDLLASMTMNGLDRNFNDAWRQAYDGEEPTYQFLAAWDYPLENRESRGKLHQAKFDKTKSLLDLQENEEAIEKEVDEAYREVITLKERILKSKQIVDLQKNKLVAETRRFEHGRSSSDLMINFQNDYLNAQDNHARDLALYAIAIDELNRVTSQLLTPYFKDEDMKL